MKLSRETIYLFDLFAKEILNETKLIEDRTINKSYLLIRAMKNIPLKHLSWNKVMNFNFEERLDNSYKGLQTALILEQNIIDKIEALRVEFKNEFKTQRIYRPFVIKLILKAAIIMQKGEIIKVMKSNENQNIKFIQQNLNFKNQSISDIIEKIEHEKPKIVFLIEYNKSLHSEIKTMQDYEFYYPADYTVSDASKMLCLLAVRKNCKFVQRKRSGMTLNLRYIEGTLIFDDWKIELFLIHVPQTFPNGLNVEYNQDRVEYKGESLFATYLFTEEYKNRPAFVGGDFNVDIRKNEDSNFLYTTRFQVIFEKIYNNFNDTSNSEPTWRQRKYDYALVSDLLKNSESQVIKTSSDHKMIISKIQVGL